MVATSAPRAPVIVGRDDLPHLFAALQRRGFRLIGPAVRQGAVTLDQIQGVQDLPAGWGDEQEAGRYRLRRRADGALFGYVTTARPWKHFLFPPLKRRWRAVREDRGFRVETEAPPDQPLALIGVRACDLAAIARLDQVLMTGKYFDAAYRARRERLFVVAVHCTEPAATCFCASMNTGPRAATFDLGLTEVIDPAGHRFVVEAGSERGAEVLAEVPHTPADEGAVAAAAKLVERAARRMGRTLAMDGLKEVLYSNLENPIWNSIADRCLTCANCTLSCPTCFCTTTLDTTDFKGDRSEALRQWDSCFTTQFSYIHGGSVRSSPMARYRQWLTHKLAYWQDQYGVPGCVGCGRCITWCPVGIDLTAEAAAIRAASIVPTTPSGKEKARGKGKA